MEQFAFQTLFHLMPVALLGKDMGVVGKEGSTQQWRSLALYDL